MAIKKIIKTVWQIRRDVTENWLLNKDTIPASGEPCYDLTLNTLKIGDGETTYENLPIIGSIENDVVVVEIQESIDNLTTQIEDTQTEMETIQQTLETKADTEAVELLETELKTYVDEQIKTVEVENIDDGEI